MTPSPQDMASAARAAVGVGPALRHLEAQPSERAVSGEWGETGPRTGVGGPTAGCPCRFWIT